MDIFLFQIIHGFADRFVWLDYLGIFLARHLAVILVVSAGVWVLRHSRKWFLGFEVLASVVLARGIFTELIRTFVQRARPFISELFVPLVPADPLEYYGSFPSGHATFFFALAMTVWLHNRQLGKYLFAGAIVMGIARIFVGIHWPSDILAGAVIGILSALAVRWVALRYTPVS